VSYDTWISDSKTLEELEKDFYVYEAPENEEVLRKLLNYSEDGLPLTWSHEFNGFVRVTYDGKDIFNHNTLFSVICAVWGTYENLLIETIENGYANLPHPEDIDVIALSVKTNRKDPTLLEISIFPDSIDGRKDFSLPKQLFLQAMSNGIITYFKTYASYCEIEEKKQYLMDHLEYLKKRLALYLS